MADGEALKSEIRDAFRHVRKPEPAKIASHSCPECDELRSNLQPHDSNTVPAEILDYHRWDLPLLSDDAKQYYLPAWLVSSIDNPQSDYTDALLYALDSDHRWLPSTPYTERQWRALEAYLDYIEAHADPMMLDDVAKARKRLTGDV
jgi:hypothetical protein